MLIGFVAEGHGLRFPFVCFMPLRTCAIVPCSIRHGLVEALVQQFHAEIGTFHLNCREYVVLPFDWTTILGLRFGGELVLTEFVSFAVASEFLGIPYPFIRMTKGYFGPTDEPQIHMQWLEENIPLSVGLDDVALR